MIYRPEYTKALLLKMTRGRLARDRMSTKQKSTHLGGRVAHSTPILACDEWPIQARFWLEWESLHLPSSVIPTRADYRESGDLRSGEPALSKVEGILLLISRKPGA